MCACEDRCLLFVFLRWGSNAGTCDHRALANHWAKSPARCLLLLGRHASFLNLYSAKDNHSPLNVAQANKQTGLFGHSCIQLSNITNTCLYKILETLSDLNENLSVKFQLKPWLRFYFIKALVRWLKLNKVSSLEAAQNDHSNYNFSQNGNTPEHLHLTHCPLCERDKQLARQYDPCLFFFVYRCGLAGPSPYQRLLFTRVW